MTTLAQYRNARTLLEKGSVQLDREVVRPKWAISQLDQFVESTWNSAGFGKQFNQEEIISRLADVYMTLRGHFALRLSTTISNLNEQCEGLFVKKNADYGDSFAHIGPVGVVLSVYNKLKRMASLQEHAPQVTSESMTDTMTDCLNYCIMTVLSIYMLMPEQP